jgi:hypothetical protein
MNIVNRQRIIVEVITTANVVSFDVTPSMQIITAPIFLLLVIVTAVILIAAISPPPPLIEYRRETPSVQVQIHLSTFHAQQRYTTEPFHMTPSPQCWTPFSRPFLPPLDDFATFPRLDSAMVTAQSNAEGVIVNSSVWGGL